MNLMNLLKKKPASPDDGMTPGAERQATAAPVAATPEQPVYARPENVSEDDYSFLLSRMPAEHINAAYDYKPGTSFLDIYKNTAKKPQELDEKKLNRAKMVAGIGDGISMLAQMYAAGKGAHVPKIDPSSSSTSYVGKRVEDLKKLYRRDFDDYSRGYQNAAFKDATMMLQNSALARKEVAGMLEARRKAETDREAMEYKKKQDASNRDYRERQLKQRQDSQAATLAERQRTNRANEAIRAARLANRGNQGDAGKDSFLYIPANEDDKNIVKIAGVEMAKYPATKEQVEDIASAAMRSDDFRSSDVYKTMIGDQAASDDVLGKYGLEKPPAARKPSSREIATAYIIWKQDEDFRNRIAGMKSMPEHPEGFDPNDVVQRKPGEFPDNKTGIVLNKNIGW